MQVINPTIGFLQSFVLGSKRTAHTAMLTGDNQASEDFHMLRGVEQQLLQVLDRPGRAR